MTTPRSARPVAADPPERPGVHAPRRLLDLLDDLHRAPLGRPGHRAGREERPQRPDRRDVLAEPAADGRDELVHRLVGLDVHQHRHLDRADLADHPDVVAEEVDDHQVLGAVLGVAGEPDPQRLVLLVGGAAGRGALDRLGLDGAVRGHQGVALRARAQQPRPGALDVVLEAPGVRRGVEVAEPEVGRDRVEVGLGAEPVGQVDLVGVARPQVLLDAGERRGVRLRSPTGWPTLTVAGRCIGQHAPRSPLRRGLRHRPRGVLERPHRRRPHPHRVGQVRVRTGGQVGAAGGAEVAEPLLPRRHRRLEHRPDVVADDLRGPARVPAHLAPRGVVRQGHVVVLEPADDRAPA